MITTATTCPWCHDRHDATALCARAQRGLTRRSFLFLTGAGVVGALLAPAADGVAMAFEPGRFYKAPRVGQLVAEAWNAAIGPGPADHCFVAVSDRHFARLMAEQLRARLPKGER
jgi:hypothetical protein